LKDGEGGLFGILTEGDIRRAMDETELNEHGRLKVLDMATTTPLVIEESATLEEASEIMKENNVTALVVMREDGNVAGIYTE
jgi:CBS domain-containing protein